MSVAEDGSALDVEIGSATGRPLIVKSRRSGGFTAKKRKAFLTSLAATCNVRRSAEVADIVHTSAYQLRRRDPAFAQAWSDALASGYARLETMLAAHSVQIADAFELPDDDGEAVRLSHAEVQSILAILKRCDDQAARGASRNGKRRPSSEEVNALLTDKLDRLARRLGFR